MADLLGGLCIFAFVLALVAVVGHGIWMLVAWIFRQVDGESAAKKSANNPTTPPTGATRSCPRCEVPFEPYASVCPVCNWPSPIRNLRVRSVAALTSMLRQIQRFAALGLLDNVAVQRLSAEIQTQRQRLEETQPIPLEPESPPPPKVPAPRKPPPVHVPTLPPPKLQQPPTPVEPPVAAELVMAEAVEDVARSETKPPIIKPPLIQPQDLALPPVETSPVARSPNVKPPVIVPSLEAPFVIRDTASTHSDAERRVQQYAVRREESHAAEPPPAAPLKPKSKPLAQLLAAFMEEKNIRWGELVGGLLIVGCSIALVFTFWSKIADQPFLKFFVFNGITAGLFGVGVYMHRRWKLETTSQGLLIIATLLVPLNFLAIAAFSDGAAGVDILTVLGELVSIGLFSALVYFAGQIVVPHWPLPLTAGVLGASIMELLVRRFIHPGSDLLHLYGIGVLPLACYVMASAGAIPTIRRWQQVGEAEANALFKLLGMLSFAVLLPFGLMLFKTEDPMATVRQLAPLVSLCGGPALAVGLLLWRKIIDQKLVGFRIAGTSIAALGALILLSGIALAWPNPAGMLPVAMLDFVVVTAVALCFELPAAHLLATPCLVLAYMLGFHLFRGNVTWHVESPHTLVRALLLGESGTALVPLVCVFGGLASLLIRWSRRLDAIFYGVAAAGTAVLSLVLVTWHGFGLPGDPAHATWVYAIYAAGALLAGAVTVRMRVTWGGSALLLAATIQGVVFRYEWSRSWSHPWLMALLLHASATTLTACIGIRLAPTRRKSLSDPLSQSALVVSLAAALLWLWFVPRDSAAALTPQLAWLAIVWLVIAVLNNWPKLFAVFQGALALIVVFAVTVNLETRPWFQESHLPWLDPWSLQTQGISLALLSLLWLGIRWGVRKLGIAPLNTNNLDKQTQEQATPVSPIKQRVASLLIEYRPIDRFTTGLVVFGLCMLSLYAVTPGIIQEVHPDVPGTFIDAAHFELLSIPHQHAFGGGSWGLLALLVVVLIATLSEKPHPLVVGGLMLTLALVCPLLAAHWESQAAVASALRWNSAALLALGSIIIWIRRWIGTWAAQKNWLRVDPIIEQLSIHSTALLLILVATPLGLLAGYQLLQLFAHLTPAGPIADSFFGRLGIPLSNAAPEALLALTLVGFAIQRRSQQFVAAAVAVATFSLAIVTWQAFGILGDPAHATLIYAFYALAAFITASIAHRAEATWIGAALLLAAMVQGIVYRFHETLGLDQPWLVALLVHASLTTVAAGIATRWLPASQREGFAAPLGQSASIVSLAVVGLLLWLVPRESAATVAPYIYWLSAIWLATSILNVWPKLFVAFQFALNVAVVSTVAAVLETKSWYQSSTFPLLDPWSLQTFGIALSLLSLFWIVVRIGFQRSVLSNAVNPPADRSHAVSLASRLITIAASLLFPTWPPLERLVMAIVVAGLCILGIYGIAPEIAIEFLRAGAGSQTPDATHFEIASIPHLHAFDVGSWIVWGVVLVVLVTEFWEEFRELTVCGLLLALAAACPLLAGHWAGNLAAGSALRWFLALLFAAVSFVIWRRERLAAWATRRTWPAFDQRSDVLHFDLTVLLLIITCAPLLFLTAARLMLAFGRNTMLGPAAGSFFYHLGPSLSYALPLATLAATLVGYGVRNRSSAFTFAGGLAFNLCASSAYLLSSKIFASGMNAPAWITLVHVNIMVLAGFALAWLGVLKWQVLKWQKTQATEPQTIQPSSLLNLQIVLAMVFNAMLIIPATLVLFLRPGAATQRFLPEVADVSGWFALALALAAALWRAQMAGRKLSVGVCMAGLLTSGAMLSLLSSRWDPNAPWCGYHTMVVTCMVNAWLLLACGRWTSRGQHSHVTLCSSLTAGLAVLLALRALAGDPQSPWWTVGALAGVSVLCGALACWSLRRSFMYVSSALANLAATIWWLSEHWSVSSVGWASSLIEFIEINIAALALPAVAWMLLDLRLLRPAQAGTGHRGLIGLHRLAAGISAVTITGLVAFGLWADAVGAPLHPSPIVGWLALSSALVAVAACLWDSAAKSPVTGLYILGLAAIGMTLDQFDLSPRWLAWTGCMITAAYAVGTSYLWSRREGLLAIADRLGIPRRADIPFAGLTWIVPANCLLVAAVMVLAYGVVLTFAEQNLRLLAAVAAVTQSVAVGLLARGERRSQLQQTALILGVIGAVAWGWAWLEPQTAGNLMNRAVVVTAVLALMVALYGLGLAKFFPRQTEWTKAAERLTPALIACGGTSLFFVLGTEVLWFARNEAIVMAWPAIVTVIVALLGMSVVAIVAAVVPGRDPLGLSERGRTIYVYAAEGFLALLFMHVRLTIPWLFTGHFLKYWPLIVMAIAFAGTGLSEIFRRQKRLVLAEPLERTGALLPLLPVLGYWMLPAAGVHYSVLLLVVGMLYAALSVTRKSFGFGIVAALAANGGLWFFLHDMEGFGLLEHPQIWLIPPALCVLAATYLNRDRLTESQMTTIRYLTSTTIYVSSTADIFLNGLAEQPWLPLVLAAFSVAGIFLGIMLRVRAFLFLGTSFLVLSLFTMIWYAAVDLHQVWIWPATGIVAGIIIIAIFALFEKKRQEVLRVVEQLKQWSA